MDESMLTAGSNARRGWAPALGLAAFSLTAALVLSGCGDEDGDVAAGGSGSPVAAATLDATSPAPTAPSAPTSPAPIAPISPAPTWSPAPSASPDYPTGDPVAVADCLPGNWFPRQAQVASLMAGKDEDVITDVSGDLMLTFKPDFTTQTSFENWTYTYPGDHSTVTISTDGTDSGVYVVADDGGIDLTDTDIGSTTYARMMAEDGNATDGAVESQRSVFSEATYSCSGDKLTVSVDGRTAMFGREH